MTDTAILREAAAGTPCYIFDLTSFKDRLRACQEILGPSISLCYSIKANPFLVPSAASVLPLLEVCSPGELEICANCQVPPQQILLSGVTKTADDISRALDLGVRRFTCESVLHARLIQAEAEARGLVLPVLLRLSAGSQFGMDETDFLALIRDRSQMPNLEIEGIHYFSGTQRKKLSDQRKELEFLRSFIDKVRETCGFQLLKAEYGTGLYFPYFVNEDRSDTLQPLRELAPDLQALSDCVQLTVEMGRFLASPCGTFLATVMDAKAVQGQDYAIVDGGIHHLNYYGGSMGMRVPVTQILPGPHHSEQEGTCMICGSLCTTADILIRNYPHHGLGIGDAIAFENCGAYSVTEAPALFLSRDMPKIFLLEDGMLYLTRDTVHSWQLNLPK